MFKRSRHSPERALQGSRTRVILIHHPDSANHNGGQLQFGPDGHLYISSGDGGYSIPRDNPLVGKPGRNEIFAWGLRNPWRFSFDAKTGRMIIGDVGQDSVEEIDYETIAGARGANFGWPQYEGDTEIHPGRPGPGPPVFPIQTYPHGPGCAVIGGSGDLRTLQPHLGGATDDQSLGLHVTQTTSFGEGNGGRIYVASLLGPVYRLVPNR